MFAFIPASYISIIFFVIPFVLYFFDVASNKRKKKSNDNG